MTLRGGEPVSALKGFARHRAAHPGRMRRLYALLVVLVMTGAIGWQLWRDPDPAGGPPGDDGQAVRSAQLESPTTHQRTVTTIVGPDTIRVVEHLTFTAPTDAVALANPEHAGATAQFVPVIKDLWVNGGGDQRQTLAPPAVGDTLHIQLPDDATEITVGYVATGVVVRTPSPVPGRALGLMTPLRPEGTVGLRAVEVRGVWVDNLGCVDEAGEISACGRGTALGWSTSPEDAQVVDVFAQLTLPND